MATATLGAADYVLLVLLLLSSAVIGAIFGFFKSKKSSAKEFLLAGGGMGVVPTALSIMVSFLSAITLLGTPSEIYLFGSMYCYQALSWIVASTITAFVFMPKFREMNCTSAYQYLELRFDRWVRIGASLTFSFFMFIYMAIVLYAPALALSQSKTMKHLLRKVRQYFRRLATGLNVWLSVVSIGVICTFYSSVGGMKAVIWTDVLQAVVILVGLLAAIIQGFIAIGGIGRTFSIAYEGKRIEFYNFNPHPHERHTIWSLLIGGMMNSLSTYGFNQTQVQRYMCVRTTNGAKVALMINAVGAAIVILLCGVIGIILYAYYAECDPWTSGLVDQPDQIFPYFVMEVLSSRPGLPGVFLACIFSGSLSTISSGLNSLAAVLIEDIYKGLLGRSITDERQGLVSKIFSVILGAVVMLLTYVVSYLGSVLNAALSLFGVLSGPIMGVFFLGFFFPQANRHGGLIGFIASLILQLWIFLGAQITKNEMKSFILPLENCTIDYSNITNTSTTIFASSTMTTPQTLDPLHDLYAVSYMWYTPIAVLTVIIVGMFVSYVTGPLKAGEVDSTLIIPVWKYCCCCIPKRFRKYFLCDTNDDDDDEENFVETEEKNDGIILVPLKTSRPNSSQRPRSNVVSPMPVENGNVRHSIAPSERADDDDKNEIQF